MNADNLPLPLPLRWPVLATLGIALLPLLLQLPHLLAILVAASWLLISGASLRWSLPSVLRLLLVVLVLATIAQQMGLRPGRDTGCALLAAMLAIKGSELRNLRDARSAIGFALFAPFAAFLLDQGPLSLLLGLLAVLAALANLARLARWSVGLPSQAALPQLRQVMLLLLLALPLALAAFWLLPRLDGPLWGLPERAVGRPGLSDTLQPGKWIDLMADDSAALRVRFDGPVPAPEQRYWRGPVMSQFDGSSWSRANLPGQAATPRDSVAQWRYVIDYEPTDKRQLVALDLPLAAPAGSHLDGQYSLRSERPLTGLTRWALASSPAQADTSALSDALRRHYLALPEGYNPRTLALGRQWRREAAGDGEKIVQRALQWVRRDFAYTLATPLPGRHLADEFLFDQQAGFCEHFSSSFAILLRSAGVPTRVVTGYTGGVRNRYGDYWVVRRMDAHAWNEVWLAGRGWVRVDPTAAVAPERIYDTLEQRLADGEVATEGLLPALGLRWQALREAGDWLRQRWNQQVLGYDAAAQARLLRYFNLADAPFARSLLMLAWLLASGLAIALMWQLLTRSKAPADPLLAAWQRLGQRYRHLGLEPGRNESAQAWAARVQRQLGDSPLTELARRYNASRYAGQADPPLLAQLRRHRPKRS